MTPEIAASLAGLAEQIESVPLWRVAENDIHLTLVPPWNEASIPGAVERLSKALVGFECFPLSFERLCYGPERRHPRLVWAKCAASPEIETLQGALLEAFGQVNERPFRPHLTLARIERKDTAPQQGGIQSTKGYRLRNLFARSSCFARLRLACAAIRLSPRYRLGNRIVLGIDLRQGVSLSSAHNAGRHMLGRQHR
jgi:2'-5' RNA ligase